MDELAAWHALTCEAALEPDLPIIDAHHHLWDRPPQRFDAPELLAEVSAGHNVRATVFVECGTMYRTDGPEHLRAVGETAYISGVATNNADGSPQLCAGIVGAADLGLGAEVREVLEAHVVAGGGHFCGIRQQAQFDAELGSMARLSPPDGLLRDAGFRAGFAELAPLGLSFDVYVYFTQLDDVADLARAFPETTIVLNHVGTPLGIGRYAHRPDEIFAHWRRGISQLGMLPNVVVKIGGLGMSICGFGFDRAAAPPRPDGLAEAWRPYVDTCISVFGPQRAMFESNFPVDKQSCSYVTLWNAFKRLTASLAPAERAALFHDTARAVYRLPVKMSSQMHKRI